MSSPSPAKVTSLPLADGGSLEIDTVLVMGILNATPDSFSDGGEIDDPRERRRRIERMLSAGVDIIDVGGESNRPGFTPVSADVESGRVMPVIEEVREVDGRIPLSIDTRKASVAREALARGASFVNDVSGLSDPALGALVADAGCAYVAMRAVDCVDPVVDSCRQLLADLVEKVTGSGIARSSIIVDPGLGFGARPGPSLVDNLALVDGVDRYSLGRPVLIGASRKRFVRSLAELHDETLVGQSVSVAVRAARAGASIVRVHDVEETIAALVEAGLRPPG